MNDFCGLVMLVLDIDVLVVDCVVLVCVIDVLCVSVVECDCVGGYVVQEKQWFVDVGLLMFVVLCVFGGQEVVWFVIYDVIWQVVWVDSVFVYFVGFQCLQVVSVDVWGNVVQCECYLCGMVDGCWWWGNVVNLFDMWFVVMVMFDGGYWFDGVKGFCFGMCGLQWMMVFVYDLVIGCIVFGVVLIDWVGIIVNDDWDLVGQCQIDSGSVCFDGVMFVVDEVLYWLEVLLMLCVMLCMFVLQFVLMNLFVGFVEGVLGEVCDYVWQYGCLWIYLDVEWVEDDLYMLQCFGDMCVCVVVVVVLVDCVVYVLQYVWVWQDVLMVDECVEVVFVVLEVKIVVQCVVFDNGEVLFDVCGVCVMVVLFGFDCFWWNVCMYMLYDLFDYWLCDVGWFVLIDVLLLVLFYM